MSTKVFKTYPRAQKPKKVPFEFSKRVLGTGAALLFGASSYAFYRYASAHAIPTAPEGDPSAAAEYRAFDVIAKKYDEAVGMEEWSLWYWMMRGQLLKYATGDVLEVSSGTGRNLKYYPLSNMRSLTLTDISDPMLSVCEDKYFDELKLGYDHPDTKVYFSIADGHCLCGEDALEVEEEPAEDPDKPFVVTRELEGSGSLLNFFRVIFQADGKIKMPEDEPKAEEQSAAAEGDDDNDDDLGAGSTSASASSSSPSSSSSPIEDADAHAHDHHDHDGDSASASLSNGGPPPSCHRCDGLGRSSRHLERCRSGVTESGLRLVRFKPRSFDTVVDTFGLCSHEDPVKVLRQMASVLRPNGRILLLEHGRSHYDWMNNWLNKGAEDHHDKWGCFWNRDIERIVKKAGLRVVQSTRWHLGTSYYLICEPDDKLRKELDEELLARHASSSSNSAAAQGAAAAKGDEAEAGAKKKNRFYFF